VRGSLLRSVGAASLLAAALCGCGGGRERGDPSADGALLIGGPDGRGSLIRPGVDANAAYSQGVELKAKGDCKAAVLKLRGPANLGPGYENAQTALGECLLQNAGTADLSSDYLEGLTWLRRAADGGWPEAQAALAQAHVAGPPALRNTAEAAYWLALYDTNPTKARIGFTPFDPTALATVRAALTPADKAAGEKRASAWVRQVWLPPAPAGNGPRGPGLDSRATRMPQQRNPN
jgi:TPR repeat protein